MAKKKTAAKKKSTAAKKPVAKKPAAPSLPTYEELLTARRYKDEMHSCVRQAERELSSANTINTFAQRDVAVASALEKLNQCREDAADATNSFENMKREVARAR